MLYLADLIDYFNDRFTVFFMQYDSIVDVANAIIDFSKADIYLTYEKYRFLESDLIELIIKQDGIQLTLILNEMKNKDAWECLRNMFPRAIIKTKVIPKERE